MAVGSMVLTVVLILFALDFQMASAFCRCFGPDAGCYECQCCKCGGGKGDCILRQDRCVPHGDMCTLRKRKCRPPDPNYCLAKLLRNFACNTTDSCNDEKKDIPVEIVVPIVVCITIIILVAICTVILALYWKFKIKVIRETRSASTYEAANQQLHEDPLYSVINTWDTPGYTEPPVLPPSRVPYYQEIESDATKDVAKTSPYYEIPLTSLPQSNHKEGKKDNNEVVEPYQEPMDALRREEPSLKLENIPSNGLEKDEKKDEMKE